MQRLLGLGPIFTPPQVMHGGVGRGVQGVEPILEETAVVLEQVEGSDVVMIVQKVCFPHQNHRIHIGLDHIRGNHTVHAEGNLISLQAFFSFFFIRTR